MMAKIEYFNNFGSKKTRKKKIRRKINKCFVIPGKKMDTTNEIGNLTNVHNQMRFIVRVHGAHAIFCCFAGRSERDREMKKDVNGS